MKATAIWIAMQAFILVGVGAGFAEAASKHGSGTSHKITKHKFVLTFEETELEGMAPVRQYLIDNNVVGDVLNGFAEGIRLPSDVPVTFKDCPGADANWDPEQKSLTFCYNLIQLYDRGYDDVEDEMEDEDAVFLRGLHEDTVVVATTMFVLLHELGHGFVDLFDLPVTGREEDAVDQFATLVLLEADETGSPLRSFPLIAAHFFKELDTYLTEIGRDILADEHSLGRQRYYNVMCLVLGSDEETYLPMLTAGVVLVDDESNKDPDAYDAQKIVERLDETDSLNLLPYRRAARCESEYARYNTSWEHMIEQIMAK